MTVILKIISDEICVCHFLKMYMCIFLVSHNTRDDNQKKKKKKEHNICLIITLNLLGNLNDITVIIMKSITELVDIQYSYYLQVIC